MRTFAGMLCLVVLAGCGEEAAKRKATAAKPGATEPYKSLKDLNARGLVWEKKMSEYADYKVSHGGFSLDDPEYQRLKFEALPYNIVAGEEMDRIVAGKPTRSKPEIDAALEATRKDLLENYGWRERLKAK